MKTMALILAAGKGTRMKSHKSKLVHEIYGKTLIERVVDTAEKASIDDIIAIVGYKKEEVIAVLKDRVKYAYQEEMLGTGHAVMQAKEYLQNKEGKVIILSGDVPLLRSETIVALLNESENDATILTAIYDNPYGYGRIVRDNNGYVEDIIEEKDASESEKAIQEINSGIYVFDIQNLLEALTEITPNNNQNEYYLTSVIKIMHDKGLKIGTITVGDNTEILGVNDKTQLEYLTSILKRRINNMHMQNGVIIEDANNTYIYDDVEIGADTVIHPNTTIKSGVKIGENCNIGPNAYIREKCELADNVKIGSFTEIKNAKIGENTKVPHLSYIGDTVIGKNTNIGCGTITCNYDGINKHETIIGDDCFIGSNVNFVAPVKVGSHVTVGAGSTITEDIPDDTLAIARERQTNKQKRLTK